MHRSQVTESTECTHSLIRIALGSFRASIQHSTKHFTQLEIMLLPACVKCYHHIDHNPSSSLLCAECKGLKHDQ